MKILGYGGGQGTPVVGFALNFSLTREIPRWGLDRRGAGCFPGRKVLLVFHIY